MHRHLDAHHREPPIWQLPPPDTWPGQPLGVRAPQPDERPLSDAEADIALRLGVARPAGGQHGR